MLYYKFKYSDILTNKIKHLKIWYSVFKPASLEKYSQMSKISSVTVHNISLLNVNSPSPSYVNKSFLSPTFLNSYLYTKQCHRFFLPGYFLEGGILLSF